MQRDDQPMGELSRRLMEIARQGAARHQSREPLDNYDRLAIDIIAVAQVEPYGEARKKIAELLRDLVWRA